MSESRKADGRAGELIVRQDLEKCELVFLESNFHSRYGELDLILLNTKSQTVVFVEVKSRNSVSSFQQGSTDFPAFALKQIGKIFKTVDYWLYKNPKYADYEQSVVLAEVSLTDGKIKYERLV